MILIKLMGGLGNQLFQYAYGRTLSLEKKERLVFDTSWYKGRINRTYMLDHFKIEATKAGILTRMLHKKETLVDTSGSWHNENYFKKYEGKIRKELSFKNPLSKFNQEIFSKIQTTNSVSIHIRGGDYVSGNKSSFHETCSADYYSSAIAIIREKVSNPHFFIFTDDINWAKGLMQFPEPFTFVSSPDNPPHEELALMSSCKHNIIANSTFSWWAAWLNPNPDKTVIGPSKWFANEKNGNSDILPASWIRI